MCAPGGGSANVTVPQHVHETPGSSVSVTVRVTSTSMTCAHRGSLAGAAPASPAPQARHSAGGSAVSLEPGSGSRCRPFP